MSLGMKASSAHRAGPSGRMRGAVGVAAVLAVSLWLAGCSEDVFIGALKPNRPPAIRIVEGPMEGDTAVYRVTFNWMGYDDDGRIAGYELVMCAGDPTGFDPADTTGLDKWTWTTSRDSTFVVSADQFMMQVPIQGNLFGRYERTHTLFVRAVDDRGGRSEAVSRSFTAWNLAPYAEITSPVNPRGSTQYLWQRTTFLWDAKDPIDSPWNYIDGDSSRYMFTFFYGSILNDLNARPQKFDTLWSPWEWVGAAGDSGLSTILGDDEILQPGRQYVFAVQIKDEAGAVTSVFDTRNNTRVFMILKPTGPLMSVREPRLGIYSFLGINAKQEFARVPTGFPLSFSWSADASSYGAIVASYRYGWDVEDVNDPNAWACQPDPATKVAPTTSFYGGIHTFYIEATDNTGARTIARIEINVFQILMDRNLLWVDDFYSNDFYQKDYVFPTETEHDSLWVHVCRRATGFEPETDIYDTAENNFRDPNLEMLWRYKNVVWTYGSDADYNNWKEIVYFWEPYYTPAMTSMPFNYIAYYVETGGHIWTEGLVSKSSGGGLSAVLSWRVQLLPINLACEITGPSTSCLEESGVDCMAYKHYCVSVLDKVDGLYRGGAEMPDRDINWDAVRYGYVDKTDPLTTTQPKLPRTLVLWEEVIAPGRYYDPQQRGFNNVELYNPAYWMSIRRIGVQPCFHPMFRIVTRSTRSAVNGATFAFWSTRFANVVAPVPGAVGAPSVHFGTELWYWNRAQIDSIADAVFTAWGIAETD